MVKIEGLQVLTALPIRLSCGLYGGRGCDTAVIKDLSCFLNF